MNFIIILLLAFGFAIETPDSTAENSSASSTPTYEEQLETGVDAFYRTDWEKATEIFDQLKDRSPEDPRAYFFESMMPFWEYFFIHQDKELATQFLEQSERAVHYSEERLQESPNDTTMVLLLSGLHGYRSLVAAGEKEYRIAMQSGISGFRYTRKLLSLDSERPDAQIGRGMFYYMVGSVPREVRWVTNAAGIRGDIEEGFKELKKAAESDSEVSNDAKMILMYLYEKEERYDEAIVYADKLIDRFPENVIFHFKKGELLKTMGENPRARTSFQEVVSLDNPSLPRLHEESKKRVDELDELSLKSD